MHGTRVFRGVLVTNSRQRRSPLFLFFVWGAGPLRLPVRAHFIPRDQNTGRAGDDGQVESIYLYTGAPIPMVTYSAGKGLTRMGCHRSAAFSIRHHSPPRLHPTQHNPHSLRPLIPAHHALLSLLKDSLDFSRQQRAPRRQRQGTGKRVGFSRLESCAGAQKARRAAQAPPRSARWQQRRELRR